MSLTSHGCETAQVLVVLKTQILGSEIVPLAAPERGFLRGFLKRNLCPSERRLIAWPAEAFGKAVARPSWGGSVRRREKQGFPPPAIPVVYTFSY